MITQYCKIAGLIVSLFLVTQIVASTPESCLLFSLTAQQTARLGIINTSNRVLELNIFNLNGEIFFNKSIPGKQNFFQVLDLTKMPRGEYSVKLTGLDRSLEKRFVITNSTVELIKEVPENLPSFLLTDDKVLVISYINSKKYVINISLESGYETIFEEKNILDIALSKRYSLKQLPPGKYTVKLSNGNDTYNFPLVLK
jgi:hypothetical protein